MGTVSRVEEAAAKLRRRIIQGEFGTGSLPREKTLADQCGCSRSTLQIALNTLRAEGLVDSVPGDAWYANETQTQAAFELYARLFGLHDPPGWPSLMAELLAYRTMLVVQVVDAMVRQGATPTSAGAFWLGVLQNQARGTPHVKDVLEAEESFFLGLANSLVNVVVTLSFNQVRRALESIRFQLAPNFALRPLDVPCAALVRAIEARDLGRATALAREVASGRDALHLQLTLQAAEAWQRRTDRGPSAPPADAEPSACF